MQAAPKPDPRLLPKGYQPPPPISRYDRMKAEGALPPMPPNPAPHIVDRLVEIGLSEAVGMGVGPLSWPTIEAWCRLTGVDLAPWEARVIRRLSGEYVAQSRRAEDPQCPPPWRAPVTAKQREVELQRLRAVLG